MVNKLTEFLQLFLQSKLAVKNGGKITNCTEKWKSHVVKKEDQFQEQSMSEESVICGDLTAVYSRLPTFTSEMQESMVRAIVNTSE